MTHFSSTHSIQPFGTVNRNGSIVKMQKQFIGNDIGNFLALDRLYVLLDTHKNATGETSQSVWCMHTHSLGKKNHKESREKITKMKKKSRERK